MIMIHGNTHLSALGMSSGFTLALPDGVLEAGGLLPYVLCLHDDAQNGERMLRSLGCEELADARRFALLLPNGQNGCFMDMAFGPAWQTYLLDDLLPFAERSFPLAEKPALMGIGTGGWAAARLKGLLPDQFSASAAICAQPNLKDEYALGRLGEKSDLEAVFGDPKKMGAFPLAHDTLWLYGEGAALEALRLLTADGSAAA